MTDSDKQSVPTLSARPGVIAAYFVIHGILGIIVPWLDIGPHYSEFEASSLAFKVGAYSRAYAMAIVFVISGVGILLSKSWARKTGLVILVVDTFYSVPEMAWGFARGKPSLEIYALATVIFCSWNGLFFYLLWRQKRKKNGTVGGDGNRRDEVKEKMKNLEDLKE